MDKEKFVDESWKEQASQEKDTLSANPEINTEENQATEEPTATQAPETTQSETGGEQAQEIEINFLNYITSLGFQAMIFMGEIPNPVTNKIEKNLAQAKFLIDTLSMLKEKTQGNLNDQENGILEGTVYELQMKYVQHSGAEQTEKTEEST